VLQHTRARSLRAIVFAFAIALGGASPALAVETSSGVSETFNIAASVTVANVPSTGTFASPPACFPSVGGCLASDYSYNFTTTIGSNNGSGLTIALRATTLVAGSSVIPLSARGAAFGGASGFVRNGAATNTNFGSLSPSSDFVLGTTSASGSVAIPIEPLLRVDSSAFPAGSYTGTLTVRAVTNP
jgi:hypothetical protein